MRRFFAKNLHEDAVNAAVGARPQNLAQLSAHLARRDYGDFRLTDAIRPGLDSDIVPVAGYRHDFMPRSTTAKRR